MIAGCKTSPTNYKDVLVNSAKGVLTHSPYIIKTNGQFNLLELLESYSNKTNSVLIIKNRYNFDKSCGKFVKTNKFLVLMDNLVYDNLISEGYGEKSDYDFLVTKYEYRSNNYPPPGCIFTILIPLSNDVKLYNKAINDILNIFIINKYIDLNSFNKSVNKKHTVITFQNTQQTVIVMIKLFLDQLIVGDDVIKVLWSESN